MTFPGAAHEKLATEGHLRGWIFAFTVSLLTALLVVSPFFWRGNASGHDIAFHASSWLDAAGQWREGIIYPRWTEWANYGFGEPRFIFYPPLSWMLGAALTLVLPGNAVPGTFIVLVQTAAGLLTFALARRFFPLRAAVFAAASYAGNPYAMLVIYMRSDFAELLACAFLPLLLLSAMQLSEQIENHQHSLSRSGAIFGILFAVIWLSNAPAGVLASYGMALLFAWAALKERSVRPLIGGAGGLALGFGLASFYLVPAAYEQRWVNIAQVLSSGLQPAENFLYTQIADPEHNRFNWIASGVAVLLMVLTGMAAFFAIRGERQEQARGDKKEISYLLLLLGIAAVVLMFRPTSIFWQYLPKLRFVQFPWRWMGILALPYAYFGAAAVASWRAGKVGARAAWICVAVVAIAVGSTGFLLVQRAWWDSDDIPSLQDAVADGKGFEGTDEYDPAGDDHYNLPQSAPRAQTLHAENSEETHEPAPKADIHVERWTAQEKIVRVSSSKPVRLALRLLNYPAWRVEVNGRPITPVSPDGTAQMIVPLPSGPQRISIRFARTPDLTMGGIASALAALGVLILLFPKRVTHEEGPHG